MHRTCCATVQGEDLEENLRSCGGDENEIAGIQARIKRSEGQLQVMWRKPLFRHFWDNSHNLCNLDGGYGHLRKSCPEKKL